MLIRSAAYGWSGTRATVRTFRLRSDHRGLTPTAPLTATFPVLFTVVSSDTFPRLFFSVEKFSAVTEREDTLTVTGSCGVRSTAVTVPSSRAAWFTWTSHSGCGAFFAGDPRGGGAVFLAFPSASCARSGISATTFQTPVFPRTRETSGDVMTTLSSNARLASGSRDPMARDRDGSRSTGASLASVMERSLSATVPESAMAGGPPAGWENDRTVFASSVPEGTRNFRRTGRYSK